MGSWDSKRAQYLEMLNEKKIKQPKQPRQLRLLYTRLKILVTNSYIYIYIIYLCICIGGLVCHIICLKIVIYNNYMKLLD